MSEYLVRTVPCPRCEDGNVTVVDETTRDQSAVARSLIVMVQCTDCDDVTAQDIDG